MLKNIYLELSGRNRLKVIRNWMLTRDENKVLTEKSSDPTAMRGQTLGIAMTRKQRPPKW